MFISTRRRIYGLWLIFCDVLSLAAAVYMSTVIRFGMTDAMRYLSVKIFPLFVNIGIFVAIFYLAGLYEPKRFDNHIKIFITVVLSVFAGMLLSSFVFYADLSLKIGRGVFVLNSFLLMIFVSLSRFLFVVTAKKRILDRKIIIVGNEEASRDVITLIHKYASSLYRVVGIINGNSVDGKAEVDGYKLLGPIEETGDLIKRREVDAIVVTSLEPKRRRVLENLRVCRYRGIEIIDVVSLYEELEGQVPLKYIDDEWLFSSSAKYPGFHVRKIKRLVDIIGSLAGLILAVPFCVIAAVLIKLDSRGPVFYRQKRLGRFGKPFRV
ncbi:MAG: sugar transferase, partial [Candidatus Omnitrophica bacterium]|nr:sugar transferase [Candidatus Omnitrophota bacterium]